MTAGRSRRRPAGARPRDHECGRQRDRGSIIPLVAGYVALLVALIVVVVDVTAVQLARARLYDVADALALDAADAIERSALYRDSIGGTVPVTDQSVRDAAERLLTAQHRPPNLASWRLGEPTGADGGVPGSGSGVAAVVTLTGRVGLPMAAGLLDATGVEVTLTVRSRARAAISHPTPSAPMSAPTPSAPMSGPTPGGPTRDAPTSAAASNPPGRSTDVAP